MIWILPFMLDTLNTAKSTYLRDAKVLLEDNVPTCEKKAIAY